MLAIVPSTEPSDAVSDQAPTHPWDEPTELVGARAVASILHLHLRYAEQVVRAGLAGPGYATARGRLVTRAAVDALARRQRRDEADLPRALVLRSGPPERVGDRWTGVHTAMPDAAITECALRWWALAEPARLDGRLVVVAVAGFAVWAGRVTGHARDGRRVALLADRATPRDAEAEVYYASRLVLPRGAVTVRVGDVAVRGAVR